MKKAMSIAFATLMVAGMTAAYAGDCAKGSCTKDGDKTECTKEKSECPAQKECAASKGDKA